MLSDEEKQYCDKVELVFYKEGRRLLSTTYNKNGYNADSRENFEIVMEHLLKADDTIEKNKDIVKRRERYNEYLDLKKEFEYMGDEERLKLGAELYVFVCGRLRLVIKDDETCKLPFLYI